MLPMQGQKEKMCTVRFFPVLDYGDEITMQAICSLLKKLDFACNAALCL